MHNIQERDIQTGLNQAWHGLTNVVDTVTKENSGIMYDLNFNRLTYTAPDETVIETDSYQISAADDNLPIGKPVSKKYQPFSNEQIWDMLDEALKGTHHEIDSIGTVNDRSIGFVSVKIADTFNAANREHNPYLNIGWGHGGTLGVIAKTGITCIVCENTFNAAMAEKSEFKVKLKHTRNANLMDLTDAIEAHIGVTAEFQMALEHMGQIKCQSHNAQRMYLGHLLENKADKKVSSRTVNVMNRMTELYREGKGNSGETMADCFNGLTDYYTHESAGGLENSRKQFESSEFGSGSQNKSRFFKNLQKDHGENLLAIGNKYWEDAMLVSN